MKERTKEELLEYRSWLYACRPTMDSMVEIIDQLLAEMEKPKMPTIDWESRPWATEVRIGYADGRMHYDMIGDRIETIRRPVTKTRAREIAEEKSKFYLDQDGFICMGREQYENDVSDAILRREKELEEGR